MPCACGHDHIMGDGHGHGHGHGPPAPVEWHLRPGAAKPAGRGGARGASSGTPDGRGGGGGGASPHAVLPPSPVVRLLEEDGMSVPSAPPMMLSEAELLEASGAPLHRISGESTLALDITGRRLYVFSWVLFFSQGECTGGPLNRIP